MWRKYFKLVHIKPGKMVVFPHGTIDFSKDNLSVDFLKSLYDKKFRYLELTTLGKEELYGVLTPKSSSKKKKDSSD